MNGFLSILDAIPEEAIAITVYVAGSFIMLWCWFFIAKRLPKMLGVITWVLGFAILLTPTVSEGTNAEIAPAFFGLLFGVLTKDHALIWSNLSLILFVVGIGLIVSFLWTKLAANKAKASYAENSRSPL